MRIAPVPPLLIDTSTLLRLDLDRFDSGPEHGPEEAATIESMVLFDRVLLDGPTVRENLPRLLWTTDIDDGVEVLDLNQETVVDIYARGAELVRAMSPWSRVTLPRGHTPSFLSQEFGDAFSPSTSWDHVVRRLGRRPETRYIIDAFVDLLGPTGPISGLGPLLLIRLFYYLALQERLGTILLLDPSKSYDSPPPSYGYSTPILTMFDQTVHAEYLKRKSKWLGESTPQVPMPPLARYVKATAERRGWSLGRTIAWLREQPEVHSFRTGMTQLMDRVEVGDAKGIDDIIAELEAAVVQWSARLGNPVPRRKVPLTVALPFGGVSVNLAVPLPQRGPAAKLLVLINMLMRSE